MTHATASPPPVSPRAGERHGARPAARSHSRSHRPAPHPRHSVLARYADSRGRPREVLTRPGPAGSLLVIDRDAATLGDRRLVAHLAADEPPANAVLACSDYLRHPRNRWCRPLSPEDLRAAPFAKGHLEEVEAEAPPAVRAWEPPSGEARLPGEAELPGDVHLPSEARLPSEAQPPGGVELPSEMRLPSEAQPPGEVRLPGGVELPSEAQPSSEAELCDHHGRAHRLQPAATGTSIPELRWHRLPALRASRDPEPVSVRDVIAALESYEPARTATVRALSRHRRDPRVSVATLGAELERVDASRIVLNRGLREAVQKAVRAQGLSMSEITLRCGHLKRDARGNVSGDTSWLARRIGLLPEGGRSVPTPWVHSDVLALIARRGLGISPREVELG